MVEVTMPAKRRAGVLCFRQAAAAAANSGGATTADALAEDEEARNYEFLLVSRHSRMQKDSESVDRPADANDSFTIPAGKFEEGFDVSCEDCALREAHEEAGVECSIVFDIGWRATFSKHNHPVQTRYFLASLVRCMDSWLEDTSRERVWMSPADAMAKVGYRDDLLSVVKAAVGALGREAAGAVAEPLRLAAPVRLPSGGSLGGEAAYRRMSSALSCMTDASNSEVEEERYVCYSHQVGGHFCMLKPAPGTRVEVELPLQCGRYGGLGRHGSAECCRVPAARVILKPFNAEEERFYCGTLAEPALSGLLQFTPLCYGTKRLRPEQIEGLGGGEARAPATRGVRFSSDEPLDRSAGAARKYLVLEDVSAGVSRPCLLDLKVGCRQRAAKHGEKKRASMKAKAARSTSAALGFRICGIQYYSAETGEFHRHDKYWGQQVTAEEVRDIFATFFGKNHRLIAHVADRVERLEATVRQLPGLRFWGGSLLVLFDASVSSGEPRAAELSEAVHTKTIDFANFEDVGGPFPDEEYLCGLANIRTLLRALLTPHGGGVEHRLASPPPPELQDEEQERAWQALQHCRADARDEARGDDAELGLGNREANALTISGAVGRALSRELASHALFRSTSDPEPNDSGSALDNLFKP